jgi:hypothetical protein
MPPCHAHFADFPDEPSDITFSSAPEGQPAAFFDAPEFAFSALFFFAASRFQIFFALFTPSQRASIMPGLHELLLFRAFRCF